MVELVERKQAVRKLSEALETAREGGGRTVLVHGEAGVGKTALTTQWASRVRDAQVLWGGCEALFSPRPLGPLYDMAGELGGDIQTLLSQDGRNTELFTALLRRLHEAPAPIVLIIEDLHWADAATLDLVKFLARRIHRTRAVLVLTYRDDELGERHALRGVLGDLPADTVTRTPLAPLSEAGVAELAQRSNRSPLGLFQATGGNPFFVTEAMSSGGLPATVRDAVLTRAARQPPAVRQLLDLAAMVPARIESSLVESILSPRSEDISEGLASGLLIADAKGFAFRHELARIALEQALAPPMAVTLHAKILACLEAAISSGEALPRARLVHHAAGANDTAAVLKYAPLAADEAIAHGAHREAAALYAVALSHAGGLAPQARAAFLDHRAYRCYLTDQIEDAIAARLSALAIWRALGDQVQEGRALRWLSRLNWFVARNAEAEAFADQAVNLLQALPPGAELAWALSNRAQLHMLADRTDEAIAWGNRAIALARELGDDEIMAHALNNVGTARYGVGEAAGRALLEQSLSLSLTEGYGEHVARAYANLTSVAIKVRDYAKAERAIQDGAAYFATRDFDSWNHHNLAWQARLEFERGRWDLAESVAGGLVARYGVATISRIPALIVLARLRGLRGDPGAQGLLDEATVLALETNELLQLGPVAAAQAEATWLRNDTAEPPSVVRQTLELAAERNDPRAISEIAFWGRKLGLDLNISSPLEPTYALQMAGDWRGASEAWAALGCPYEQALALLEGDDAAINRGLEQLTSLGASAVARRFREQLRQAGVRGLARGPRDTTTRNPGGLTAREMQILALLTQGLTNAEIAARLVRAEKTVDHHISAILRKLEVRSRAEAAVIASRLGLSPSLP